MDELYIQMCREATEIQELRPKSSYFPPVKDGEVVSDIMGNRWVSYDTSMEQYRVLLWLPRQEDLQQIYQKHKGLSFDCCYLQFKKWNPFHYNQKYTDHYGNIKIFTIFETGSWTVLWLCFVMETVYHKVWNGTTWEPLK